MLKRIVTWPLQSRSCIISARFLNDKKQHESSKVKCSNISESNAGKVDAQEIGRKFLTLSQHRKKWRAFIPHDVLMWYQRVGSYKQRIYDRFGKVDINNKDKELQKLKDLTVLGDSKDRYSRFLQAMIDKRQNQQEMNVAILERKAEILQKMIRLDEWKKATARRKKENLAIVRAAQAKRDRLAEDIRRIFELATELEKELVEKRK